MTKVIMPRSASSPRVLYIVYWGATESLGQSLVLPAVQRLAYMGARLTLVTFEKPDDARNHAVMSEIRSSLAACGVRWIPLRYHKKPKGPATAFDLTQGVVRSLLARLRGRFDIVHARTYIGGLIGLLVAPRLRTPLIYHSEGVYPDEQVDAGVWRFGSRIHRLARRLEQTMYAQADGIIALSRRGKQETENLPTVRTRQTPVIVVPSCVDLSRFVPPLSDERSHNSQLRLIYVGSIGGRYDFARLARFVSAVSAESSGVELCVLTGQQAGRVKALIHAAGLPASAVSVTRVPHLEVPSILHRQHAGLHFLRPGISKHAGSPTKLGEYWACGLPVVVTSGIGDTDEIIHRERVGVIVREHSDAEYRRAARELLQFLADPDLPHRCRAAAERHYSLETGCHTQLQLYRRLSGGAYERFVGEDEARCVGSSARRVGAPCDNLPD